MLCTIWFPILLKIYIITFLGFDIILIIFFDMCGYKNIPQVDGDPFLKSCFLFSYIFTFLFCVDPFIDELKVFNNSISILKSFFTYFNRFFPIKFWNPSQ